MKLLDKFIRYWRVTVALKNTPVGMDNVFDIGCDDGYLLKKLSATTKRQDGIEPRLQVNKISPTSEIRTGFFPAGVEAHQKQATYDAIFALAVFEHFSEEAIRQSAMVIPQMLRPKGRLIITVPHPFVDKILDVLMFLHLIAGETAEEHHGFNPEELLTHFSNSLRLVKREKFQLGLNNVFVFERY